MGSRKERSPIDHEDTLDSNGYFNQKNEIENAVNENNTDQLFNIIDNKKIYKTLYGELVKGLFDLLEDNHYPIIAQRALDAILKILKQKKYSNKTHHFLLIYTILIAGKANDIETAKRYYNQLLKINAVKKVDVHNAMIRAAGFSGRLDMSLELFKKILTSNKPNARTYDAIISAYKHANRQEEYKTEDDEKKDFVTKYTVLKKLTLLMINQKNKGPEISISSEILDGVRQSNTLDQSIIALSKLARLLGSHRPDHETLNAIKEMLRNNINQNLTLEHNRALSSSIFKSIFNDTPDAREQRIIDEMIQEPSRKNKPS